MGRWTGETVTLQVGPKWTYKLRLEERTETGPRSTLVVGTKTFDSEQDAKTAGDVHLKAELEKRSD